MRLTILMRRISEANSFRQLSCTGIDGDCAYTGATHRRAVTYPSDLARIPEQI